MGGLETKYFILKPKSKYRGDPYARASRRAMFTFADWISAYNPELSKELTEWAERTDEENINMEEQHT